MGSGRVQGDGTCNGCLYRVAQYPFHAGAGLKLHQLWNSLIVKMSIDKNKHDMEDIKYVEETEDATHIDVDRAAAEKALVRKIDITLLPCIWIMYLLSYMDVRGLFFRILAERRLTTVLANQHRQCQSCRNDRRPGHGLESVLDRTDRFLHHSTFMQTLLHRKLLSSALVCLLREAACQ